MSRTYTSYKEVVELFVQWVFRDLQSEHELPKLNFKFNEEAYEIFNEVKNNPFEEADYFIPNIEKKDINKIKKHKVFDNENPTIYVEDAKIFFEDLTTIINLVADYNVLCENNTKGRYLAILTLQRIWLKMGINDFTDVNGFLKRNIEYLKDKSLIEYCFEDKIVDNINGHNVYCYTTANPTFYETYHRCTFYIIDSDGKHFYLPSVYYEIINDTCYIYAVQMLRVLGQSKDKKIERSFYSLNKGIENPVGHPKQRYSLLLFTKLLRKKGIKTIEVPTMQVLNYKFHEILSEKNKYRFEMLWDEERIEHVLNHGNRYEKKAYEEDLLNYEKFVDKQDSISKRKTEDLFALIEALSYYEDIELINDIDVQDNTLIYKLK